VSCKKKVFQEKVTKKGIAKPRRGSMTRKDMKEPEESDIYMKAAEFVDRWAGEEGVGEKSVMEAFDKSSAQEREKWLRVCTTLINMPSRRAILLVRSVYSKHGIEVPDELQE
jgi:hypothetical protein